MTRRAPVTDINAEVAAVLYDYAYAQTSTPKRFGYKRAGAAIRFLDVPIDTLAGGDGSLEQIFGIGPASSRIILEYLESGHSDTVERAIQDSPLRADVQRRRQLREHFLSRAVVVQAVSVRAARGESRYRGDLQMHSRWSDGSQSIAQLIEGCAARGYEYCAITDHAYGLPIAHGLSMAALADQHLEIDRLNEANAGRFRVIKSIEANILADGRLDMQREELRQLEIVLAAPHSKLRSAENQTKRMLAAVGVPGLAILGHPRGRIYGSRGGVLADWPAVFEAAAKANVAVELDGDPSRQDLDYDLAGHALDAGCLFALDSDAHGVGDFPAADIALAHAELAGIPADRIINTWPVDRLLAWARRRER